MPYTATMTTVPAGDACGRLARYGASGNITAQAADAATNAARRAYADRGLRTSNGTLWRT